MKQANLEHDAGPRQVKTLQDLVNLAGDSMKLANKLKLKQFNIESWRRCGVPLKYWDKICDIYDITPIELYAIRNHCKARLIAPCRVK